MMEKREKASKIIIILFTLFFVFTVLQFISPLLLPSNMYQDFTGTVGVSDNDKHIESIPFPLNIGYLIGDRLCHQKQERSLTINGNQMPFCSRCTAIWVGITIGLSVLLFFTIELNQRFMTFILVSLIPIGVDGTGQLLGFWESSHLSRILTGLIIGIPVGMALGVIVDELKSLFKSKIN